MLVNSITNFNYGANSALKNKAMQNRLAGAVYFGNSEKDTKPADEGEQQTTENKQSDGKTAGASSISISPENKNRFLKAISSFLIPATVTSGTALTTGCDAIDIDIDVEAKASADALAKVELNSNTHPKGCSCGSCCKGRDTIYIPGPTQYVYYPVHTTDTIIKEVPGPAVHDTTYIDREVPGPTVHDTVYVDRVVTVNVPTEILKYIYVYRDTGSYHVVEKEVEKWIHDWEKPIPLDTLAKDVELFDLVNDQNDPTRKNIVSYQGIREWEYGDRFVADADLVQSNKYKLVYKREDLDWEGKHIGRGYDVYRKSPQNGFKIKNYDGTTLTNQQGLMVEFYHDPYDSEHSMVDDCNLVSRHFIQTNKEGKFVAVWTYDQETDTYRRDGSVGKGYLDKETKGQNICLTNLIASNPDEKFSDDPNYSTEDHLTFVHFIGVNDEELLNLYLKQKDDLVAEYYYGVADNGNTTRSGTDEMARLAKLFAKYISPSIHEDKVPTANFLNEYYKLNGEQ